MRLFADRDGEPRIFTHSQDLKAEAAREGRKSRHWFNRRWWLQWDRSPRRGNSIEVQVAMPSHHVGAGVEFEDPSTGGHAWHVALYLGIVAIYTRIEDAKWVKRLPGVRCANYPYDRSGKREIEVSISWVFEPAVRWSLWTNPDDWPLRGPGAWRRRLITFEDMLYGRSRTTDRVIAEGTTTVPMPEGDYTATWQRIEYTTRWRRWPRAKVWHRWQIDTPQGIPFPGKGENSWDQGDDATYSFSAGAQTPSLAAAIDALRASVLEDRRKYGGPNWVPERTTK